MRTLLSVTLWRPSYPVILEALVNATPRGAMDLILTNDTGSGLIIEDRIADHFRQVIVFEGLADLMKLCPELPVDQVNATFRGLDGVAFWQNLLTLYGMARCYDALILWEDDQFPICTENEDFFSSQLNLIRRNPETDVVVSRRVGYLHRVPPYINRHYPGAVLAQLEGAMSICNEIVYPGLFTKDGGAFVPVHGKSSFGGIEYFRGKPFIYAGSLAINLNRCRSMFYSVPDLPGRRFARGNDVLFSLGFGNEFKVLEASNRYFHDPWMSTLEQGMEATCRKQIIDRGSPREFNDLINGWLTYAPLLLQLAAPDEWSYRKEEVLNLLARVEDHFPQALQTFKTFSTKSKEDLRHLQETRMHWNYLCASVLEEGAANPVG